VSVGASRRKAERQTYLLQSKELEKIGVDNDTSNVSAEKSSISTTRRGERKKEALSPFVEAFANTGKHNQKGGQPEIRVENGTRLRSHRPKGPSNH
jgi:hypothetical protein